MDLHDGSREEPEEISKERQVERPAAKTKRDRPKHMNPLQAGIQNFVINKLPPSILSANGVTRETLFSALPKRFTVYQPLLLLPANAFSSPPAWGAIYRGLDNDQRVTLYASIATAFSSMGVTHVAINAPIEAKNDTGKENRMRSPTGLVPLHGHFGPFPQSGDREEQQPTSSDFESAFWVHTSQNGGIVQTWAPLHTMFSRGNITEKARILGQGSRFDGLDEDSLEGKNVQDISVVDMYAGIGYFVFSYLKRGVKRVWGFEINGWSVEGLRRGCMNNGWGCKVVQVHDDGTIEGGIQKLVDELGDAHRVVVFHGDNKFAADILRQAKDLMEFQGSWNSVRHVNLGLLPTSKPAYECAYRLLDRRYGGWAHVHENVDIRQIDEKRDSIIAEFKSLSSLFDKETISPGSLTSVQCQHVEQVKTYAPGVMHCVFDIELTFGDP
ncbi:S-adenosylmethionine-dependent methyltransferase [Paecilomyces lecythidis]|uniref:tRNA wybutosine-synthesizing protein 2 n=1 Tax=Paecilomyces lecythidis TaxID=3004212 RepID=A0ABR3XFZ2_9EURO